MSDIEVLTEFDDQYHSQQFAQALNRVVADREAAARRQGYQDAIDLLRSRCEDFSDAAADLLAAALTEGKDSA